MIDEQHPMQIGMFPMDIKCHTPQQLQQQLQQQQQQIQQQQQQQQPHFNSHNTTGGDGIRVRASTGAAAVVVTSPTSANVIGNHRSSNHNNNGNTTANSANNNSSSSNSTNNNNTNSNNSSNSGSNANSQSANNSSNNNKTISSLNSNQQSNAGAGPGPPGSAAGATITTGQTSPTSATMTGTTAGTGGVAVGGATNATNASTSGSGRVTLAECVVNGGPLGVVVGGRGNNNNNNHNNNTNHNNNSSNNANNNNFNGNISHCGLDGNCEQQQQQQQQLQHQQQNQQHPITIQQQQQHTMLQHHLQQLQLHPPQPPVILSQQQQVQFHHHHNNNNQHNKNNNHHHNNNHQHQRLHHHHHHQHHHHPAAILHQHSNGSASVSAGMGDVINVVVAANGTLSSNGSTNNNHSPCSTSNAPMAQCGHCCQPICDRYIMRVVDTSYHESCLKCSTCALHLVHSCFARDGKLYCRIDYERLFIRNRCLGCGHKIGSEELVMRTLENVFHLKCFACVVCGALLKKGEQYVVKQGQLFCRFDYEKEVEMLQGYEDFYGDDLFPPKLDGRRGPKRPRTILNTQQRRAFKASFEVSPKPCRKVRENLAKETGLSLRIVQVWFQNQRAKVKKIQKKAKQEHAKGASETDSQESDSSLAKIKDEAHSDTESLLESPFSACGIGGSGLGVGVAAPDGVSKLRLVKDENENAAFNCMETNKENCNKTNEPILNTILGLSYATFQQLMGPFTQSPMVNPIDRLYSMQNSYFRPEDMGFGECGGPKEMVDN